MATSTGASGATGAEGATGASGASGQGSATGGASGPKEGALRFYAPVGHADRATLQIRVDGAWQDVPTESTP